MSTRTLVGRTTVEKIGKDRDYFKAVASQVPGATGWVSPTRQPPSRRKVLAEGKARLNPEL